jgi:hypothetical protein
MAVLANNIEECKKGRRLGHIKHKGKGHEKGKGKGHTCLIVEDVPIDLNGQPLTETGTNNCDGGPDSCTASVTVPIGLDEGNTGQDACDEKFGPGRTLFVSFIPYEFYGRARVYPSYSGENGGDEFEIMCPPPPEPEPGPLTVTELCRAVEGEIYDCVPADWPLENGE